MTEVDYETSKDNMLFLCSLVEVIGRMTKNRRQDVVKALGRNRIEKIFDLADVYHCEPIEYTAEDFIKEVDIKEGTFDNVGNCEYEIPGKFAIGGVLKRLVVNISEDENISLLDAFYKAFDFFIIDKIEDFNSSVFYDNSQSIFLMYQTGSVYI